MVFIIPFAPPYKTVAKKPPSEPTVGLGLFVGDVKFDPAPIQVLENSIEVKQIRRKNHVEFIRARLHARTLASQRAMQRTNSDREWENVAGMNGPYDTFSSWSPRAFDHDTHECVPISFHIPAVKVWERIPGMTGLQHVDRYKKVIGNARSSPRVLLDSEYGANTRRRANAYRLDGDGYVINTAPKLLYYGTPTTSDPSPRFTPKTPAQALKEQRLMLAKERLTKTTMYDWDEIPLGFSY